MTSKYPFRLFITISLILIFGLSTGCSNTQVTPAAETPSNPDLTPVASTSPSPTIEPPTIWLVSGPQAGETMRQEFSSWLAAKAAEEGYQFAEVETFRTSDLPAHLFMSVFLSTDDDIESLAANLPDTQFVAVSNDNFSSLGNLNTLRTSSNQAAFLAGYLATLNAPDFRSGGLFLGGTENSGQLEESFLNGGRFLCGRCSPVFTPLVPFPQTGMVPSGADAAGWQAAFDGLNQNRIEMLYLPAEGLTPEFLSYLADKNIGLLSDAPPPSGYDSIWVATVTTNPLAALESLWLEILAGNTGISVSTPLEITHVNPDNLSTGRLQMAEKIIPELLNGQIAPLSVP